jgi:transcriptional regulator with XRE-family HTH domain
MTDINVDELARAVGRAIARQRQKRGLTQDRVAEHLNIGLEAVSRMERGVVVPTIIRLAELAQLFDCDVADLLRESSNRPTEQGIVLAQQLAQLGSADRELILELVARLSSRLAQQ